MKRPTAFPMEGEPSASAAPRTPRAFAADEVADVPAVVASYSDSPADPETMPVPARKHSWLARILWTTAGALISLGLGLAADNLIRSLFETNAWLGWVGLTVLGLFLVALVAVIIREVASLWRLRTLDHL